MKKTLIILLLGASLANGQSKSWIMQQLAKKADTSLTNTKLALIAAGGTSLTGFRAVVTNESGGFVADSTTDAEVGWLHGVTSPIQTQLNALAGSSAGAKMDSTRVNYLRGQDTARAIVREGVLQTAINGKQASGTYLVPTDSTNNRTYSNSLYQAKATYLTPTDSNSFHNQFGLKAPLASPVFTGRWTGSSSIRGTATFTTTGTRVAVYVPGTASTDIVVVTPTGSAVVTTTNLTVLAKTDSIVIFRGSSGTSGAVMNWILMR